MNREDRANFVMLIQERQPALLAGVETEGITDDQIMTLVAQAMTPPPHPGEAVAIASTVVSGVVPVAARLLGQLIGRHGLRYQDHVQEQVEEGGVTRQVWRTTYRPLTPADVLASRDAGTHVSLVAADGKKYSLPKA